MESRRDEAAEQQRRACEQEALAAAQMGNMEGVDNADAYMKLSRLAMNAHQAWQALEDAKLNHRTVTNEHTSIAHRMAAIRPAKDRAMNSNREAERHNDWMEGNWPAGDWVTVGRPALVGRCGLLRDNAVGATDNARTATTEAAAIVNEDPNCAAEKGRTAATQGASKLKGAADKGPAVRGEVQALPPAPVGCANAAEYDATVVRLQDLTDAVFTGMTDQCGQDATQWQARAGTLDTSVQAAGPAVTGAQGDAAGLVGRRIYTRDEHDLEVDGLRRGRNHFTTDFESYVGLAQDAAAAADTAGTHAQTVNDDIHAMKQEMDADRAHYEALRQRYKEIYEEAHSASQLIDYDPEANSTAANEAIDRNAESQGAARAVERQSQGAADAIAQAEADLEAAEQKSARAQWDNDRAAEQQRQKTRTALRHAGAGFTVRNALENAVTRGEPVDVNSILQGCKKKRRVGARKAVEDYVAAADVASGTGPEPDNVMQGRLEEAFAKNRLDRLRPLQAEIEESLSQARECSERSQQATNRIVRRRLDQLQQEGHGPQRHEGGPTRETLEDRAMFTIDPETHTQLDAESGQLHSADANATKFRTEAYYVKAEALARQQQRADHAENARLRALGNEAEDDDAATVLLTDIGPNVAVGVTCTNRPETRETTLGPARRVPTLPTYQDDGTQPPPTRAQFDEAELRRQASANTEDYPYQEDAVAFAVLRKDRNGQVFLRTMWPQNPGPAPNP